MDDPNSLIKIPVWFAKLVGYMGSLFVVAILTWMSWVTVTVIQYELHNKTLSDMQVQISELDKKSQTIVRSLDAIIGRMRWDRDETIPRSIIPTQATETKNEVRTD